jgi:uncharacterized protein YkwD
MVYQIVPANRSLRLAPLDVVRPLVGPSLVALAGFAVAACGPAPLRHGGAAAAPAAPREVAASSGPAAPPAERPRKELTRPDHKLTVPEARRYMLALVNRDRATQGLPPVELDEGAATKAGQAHADDMARLGYLGHWGSDGSVPEQRHTEAGGADMVLENALCFVDEKPRKLDPKPLVDPEQLERAEAQFFEEVPPNDGHRKNILKPTHTKVGIGVAQPFGTRTELAVPCVSQEFTDAYGTYAPLPAHAKLGATVKVEGTLARNAKPTGVGVARVVLPKPIPTSELNRRRSYPVPKPFQMYWGPGFVTPVPVKIDGAKFSIEVPLSEGGQPGLYEISVWGKVDGGTEQTMLGLRTVRVE